MDGMMDNCESTYDLWWNGHEIDSIYETPEHGQQRLIAHKVRCLEMEATPRLADGQVETCAKGYWPTGIRFDSRIHLIEEFHDERLRLWATLGYVRLFPNL